MKKKAIIVLLLISLMIIVPITISKGNPGYFPTYYTLYYDTFIYTITNQSSISVNSTVNNGRYFDCFNKTRFIEEYWKIRFDVPNKSYIDYDLFDIDEILFKLVVGDYPDDLSCLLFSFNNVTHRGYNDFPFAIKAREMNSSHVYYDFDYDYEYPTKYNCSKEMFISQKLTITNDTNNSITIPIIYAFYGIDNPEFPPNDNSNNNQATILVICYFFFVLSGFFYFISRKRRK